MACRPIASPRCSRRAHEILHVRSNRNYCLGCSAASSSSAVLLPGFLLLLSVGCLSWRELDQQLASTSHSRSAGARAGANGRHPLITTCAPHAPAWRRSPRKKPEACGRCSTASRRQPVVRSEGAAVNFDPKCGRQRLHRPRLRRHEGNGRLFRISAPERADRPCDEGRRTPSARAQARAFASRRHPQAARQQMKAASSPPRRQGSLSLSCRTVFSAALPAFSQNPPLERIQLPGFRIESRLVPNARHSLGPKARCSSAAALAARCMPSRLGQGANRDGMSMPTARLQGRTLHL